VNSLIDFQIFFDKGQCSMELVTSGLEVTVFREVLRVLLFSSGTAFLWVRDHPFVGTWHPAHYMQCNDTDTRKKIACRKC
jgi:hypothetical protein